MRNLVISAFVFGAASMGALADSTPATRNIRLTPCSFWIYEPDIGGYLCRTRGTSVEVPRASDVRGLQRTVSDLQATVRDLQQRVEQLEQDNRRLEARDPER